MKITNSLFESIKSVTQAPVEEAAVDKAHFCATHVEHSLYGKGECISEQHAEPDADGKIAWYTVKFPAGVMKVTTDNLNIIEGKSHTHGKKMAEDSEQVEEGNDGNLANNAKPYDKVTRGDVIAGRLGKDEMGGKKKVKDTLTKEGLDFTEEETVEEGAMSDLDADRKDKAYQTRQAKTTKSAANANSPFNWKGTPRQTREPGELTGHSAKKIPTGTVYSKKAVKENVSQTVINHGDFTIEVTDNPTFKDFFNAMGVTMTSESVDAEAIKAATLAYTEKNTDIIVQSLTKKMFESKIEALRKSGATVTEENYMVDSGEPYAEYVVDQNGVRTHHIHTGKVEVK